MTPEEISYQKDFLYPLYLILIGGLITGGLIPFFNRIHGSKLKKIETEREEAQKRIENQREEAQKRIENQREEAQKRIDRKREDHQKELDIKSEIVKKISEVYAISASIMYELAGIDDKQANFKSTTETETFQNWFKEREITTSLMDAYFEKSKLNIEWRKFAHILGVVWILFDRTMTKEAMYDEDVIFLEKYFKGKIDTDWRKIKTVKQKIELWNTLNLKIHEVKDELIKKTLHEEITIFNKIESKTAL